MISSYQKYGYIKYVWFKIIEPELLLSVVQMGIKILQIGKKSTF